MSKKYYARVLKGTGVQEKRFESKFGSSILQKFGWHAGDGLGKQNDGAANPVQIRRRPDLLGVSASSDNVWLYRGVSHTRVTSTE